MRTKFCGNYFLGKGFRKTSAHLFLNLDVANGKGGVWGGIFHLLLFLFWGNSGGLSEEKYNIKFSVKPRITTRNFLFVQDIFANLQFFLFLSFCACKEVLLLCLKLKMHEIIFCHIFHLQNIRQGIVHQLC